jgi:hypothetical protein
MIAKKRFTISRTSSPGLRASVDLIPPAQTGGASKGAPRRNPKLCSRWARQTIFAEV